MYGRGSIAKWPEEIGGPCGSRRFCSNLTILLLVHRAARTWRAGRGPEQAGVGDAVRECGMSAGECVRTRVQGTPGRWGVGRNADLVPTCLGLKPSCVTLDKSFTLPLLQFAPLKNGDGDTGDGTNFTGWL